MNRFLSTLSLLILLGIAEFSFAQEQTLGVDSSSTAYQPDSTTHKHHRIPFWEKSHSFNKKRFALVAGSTTLALGASFIYVNNSWWADQSHGFHFDGGTGLNNLFTPGNDLKYAKNLDKFGHFFGGIIYSDMFSNAVMWSGVKERRAKLWGGIFGTCIQGFIEIKDGYSPTWGFSVYDLMAGSLGSFYPYFQTKSKFLAATDVKLSYYKRDDFYFKNVQYKAKWNDDYMNQTYWFSFSPKRFNNEWKWPKWLGIAAGFGVDNKLNNYYLGTGQNYVDHGKGGYEFFIAPDIDFKGLLPNRPFWQKVGHVLNYVKFPAPTIRLSNDSKFFFVYF